MKTIWKKQISENSDLKVELPTGAQFLDVQVQNISDHGIMLWFLVDTEQPLEVRYFKIIGTGHEIITPLDRNFRYCGTVQQANGALVWHVFEDRPSILGNPYV